MVTNGDRKTNNLEFWKIGPSKSWSFFKRHIVERPPHARCSINADGRHTTHTRYSYDTVDTQHTLGPAGIYVPFPV